MHRHVKHVAVYIVAAGSWLVASSGRAQAPIPSASIVVPATTTTTTSSTTTTTTTYIPSDAVCGEWWSLALDSGFTSEMLPALDKVLYVESRCDAAQHNATDPNGGSHGLTQINGFWCLPSRYYPLGYLQTHDVLTECADLYDPGTNLRAAYALVVYSVEAGVCAWHQWAWYEGCD